jgi:hypothetical protein
MRRIAPVLALALAAAALAPLDAGAIPAFARRYRVSCTTCHAPFPRLKAYGEEFAGRGFALEPGAEPARATVDLGDELLALPRDFPVAIRFDAFAQLQDRSPESDFQAPWILKALAGGQIAQGIGFYTYFIIEHGELVGLEDAYVHFSEPFGVPVDVLAGQFQLADPIVKRELRLERLDYEILKTRVGGSIVNLTYDRGIALSAGGPLLGALLTVTNGNGIGAASGETLDKDSYKNFGLHLASDLGLVRVGLFGLIAKERGASGALNTTWYAGPDVVVSLADRATVTAAFLERRDSNPFFDTGAESEVRTRGGFVEAVVFPAGSDGRWALVGLYNKVRSGTEGAAAESVAAAASWLLRRNVRVTAEIDRDVEGGVWTGSLGTVASF